MAFVETFADKLLDHYLDEEGNYVKSYLYNFGDKTRLQMNCIETLKILSTPVDENGDVLKDFDKEAFDDSISKASIMLHNALPEIIKMLAQKIPEKLDEMRWKCLEISYSPYNSKYITYKGRDPANLTKCYGAPAYDIILHLKPDGKFPVCAPLKEGMYMPKQKHASEATPPESPAPKQASKTAPNPASTSAPAPASKPAPAPTVKQTYANASAGGGGGSAFKKPFNGKS
jgi:cell division septation protein DedD